MAGDAIHGPRTRPIRDQISVQIPVMIARQSPFVSTAHTAAIAIHFSHTCHAARHDVNDPQ